MFSLLKRNEPASELLDSKLFDQETFYRKFLKDLDNCSAAITDAWDAGKDVFALYGSGHAIVLENALKKLGE